MNGRNVVDRVIEILKKYPLCERCLGRLFGYLGKGINNLERGRALKISTLLEVHRRLQENEMDKETAKLILINTQMLEYLRLLELDLEGSISPPPCYICGNMIDKWIEQFSEKVLTILQNLKVSSFVIGVTSADRFLDREEGLAKEFNLSYRESIKRELKREIGKRVSALSGLKPSFDRPDVTFMIDLERDEVAVSYPSMIVYGYYWKLGRNISQNIWIGKDGRRKYPLALEDAVKEVCRAIGAEGYKLHIAGREDVDVRVLGSGRPIALEFKVPGKRLDMEYIENLLNSFTPWLKFSIKMKISRGFVSRLKKGAELSRKIYRAIVYTSRPIAAEELKALETLMSDKVIEQRTPTRILRRKKDTLRRKKVYSIKVIPIAPQLFEALIYCDGGLYVKELISGDNGRTNPSFSSVLGCNASCVMLDVLYVHEYI